MHEGVEDVIASVRADFDPMMVRLGTRGPLVARRNTYFFLGYFGTRLGMQLEVQLPYFSISPMVFRPGASGRLPVDSHDAAGRVFVLHLHEALEKLGLPYVELPRVRKLRQQGDSGDLAVTLAQVIERHWDAMSRRVDELLPVT